MTPLPSHPRSRSPRSGFTLLELILAMAVTCMLALSLYASLHTAFKAQASATAAVEPIRTASIALELLGHDLQSALPPTGTLAGPFYGEPAGSSSASMSPSSSSSSSTSGSAGPMGMSSSDLSDTLEFYCLCNGVDDDQDPTRGDGIRRIDITLEALPDGTQALVRRVQRNLLSTEEFPPDEEVLCRNVTSLTFQYFDGQDWYDQWDSTAYNDTLPVAVQVTLQLANPSGADRPPYTMVRTFSLPCSVPTRITGESQ